MDSAFICRAIDAGVQGIIVDWENIGKADRQFGADTQINHDTLDDLKRVRACTDKNVLCRINRFGSTTGDEIEQATDAGVDEILLPMVQTQDEVKKVLTRVGGRCGVGILVETVTAIEHLDELAQLPLSRIYVGLNDLAIERKSPHIFTALADKTVEYIRQAFSIPFGFGGLTLPDRGVPIPCRLLIGELARLNCNFSFLRRSFYRDIQGQDLAIEIPRILKALHKARQRLSQTIDQDRYELEQALENLSTTPCDIRSN